MRLAVCFGLFDLAICKVNEVTKEKDDYLSNRPWSTCSFTIKEWERSILQADSEISLKFDTNHQKYNKFWTKTAQEYSQYLYKEYIYNQGFFTGMI